MNECFGGNYNHYFNDAVKDIYGGMVWFPKERVKDKNGEWKPGSNEVNWKNYLSDDGTKVYMYLNPGETIKDGVKERPSKPVEANGEIILLAANSCAKGKCIGTFLLKELERRYKAQEVYLFTDSGCTYQFYEHRGFEKVGSKNTILEIGGKKIPLECMMFRKKLV